VTTVALAIAIWRTRLPETDGPAPPTERTLRWLALLLVVMVVGQGVMGGLRVTETNLPLAIAHGIFGQVFLATMSIAWAMSTRTWRAVSGSAGGGVIAWVLLAIVGLQLTTGALARHLYTEATPMPWPTHVHLTLAVFVVLLSLHVALRSWARGGNPMLRRFGLAMFVIIGLQIVLGFVALAVVLARQGGPNAWEIVVTTLHQVNGALVLLTATQLAVWTHRVGLTAPTPDTAIAPA
jgi:cytochrome c oxidase assembly protein subunit 15